ncbi:MAG: Rne/Rng family ribonuclease [Bacteroidetes bacterium]|nr:Rne/Rng family ribonuclease [Bacteroidota bacterium]
MRNELVISIKQDVYRIALLKEDKLTEYHIEEKNSKFTVGDVYLGIVKKIVPGLNAAFVDVGHSKDAFLHYLDMGIKFSALDKFLNLALKKGKSGIDINAIDNSLDLEKEGKISEVLSVGQKILVQVVKEPISTKGPRLSCEISLAGRYGVIVPFSNEISISRRLKNVAERKRLFRLVSSIKPRNFGVIIRTVSENKEVAELDRDLKALYKKWEIGTKALENAQPRQKIIGEINRVSSILRDILNESFDKIIVDDFQIYNEIKEYISRIAPEKGKIVKLYKGTTKLFEKCRIEKQIKSLFGQVVSLEGGGYLVIEHTEAMHVVDVNSGNRSYSPGEGQEGTALAVNIAAAKEIARQLRLRDMGGIIVVDFIDMKKLENKQKVHDEMKMLLAQDRSKARAYKLSKSGLMEITRQRVRPETNIITKEQCPSCGGTGQIDASILIADDIDKTLHHIIMHKSNTRNLTIFLHPYLYAYFTKGLISKRTIWFFKYKHWINLEQDSSLGITDYRFINGQGEEIEID